MQGLTLEAFQRLPTEEVARLVRADGPKVCVFPINGTRRWLMLEYPKEAATDFVQAYLQIGGRRLIEIYKQFFDHGVDTLLMPVFGPDILERGEGYLPVGLQGLSWFARSDDFLGFYDDYGVRVRVYGDYRRHLQNTSYASVLDVYDGLAQHTAHHQCYRLFFGVCAHDATETIAEITIRFHEEHGCLPSRREIVEAYYGEYVEPVSFFVGFGCPAAFDMPLLALGSEDLYFTISPSLYLDSRTLRAILYDHLYARRVDEASYAGLSPGDWQSMADFYTLNRKGVLGLGQRHASGGFWYPSPQVELPLGIVSECGRSLHETEDR